MKEKHMQRKIPISFFYLRLMLLTKQYILFYHIIKDKPFLHVVRRYYQFSWHLFLQIDNKFKIFGTKFLHLFLDVKWVCEEWHRFDKLRATIFCNKTVDRNSICYLFLNYIICCLMIYFFLLIYHDTTASAIDIKGCGFDYHSRELIISIY